MNDVKASAIQFNETLIAEMAKVSKGCQIFTGGGTFLSLKENERIAVRVTGVHYLHVVRPVGSKQDDFFSGTAMVEEILPEGSTAKPRIGSVLIPSKYWKGETPEQLPETFSVKGVDQRKKDEDTAKVRDVAEL